MLIRQTALYFPAQLLGPLVQLAAMIVWTHWLVPHDFGIYALVVAAQELLYLALLYFWTQFMLRFLTAATGGDGAGRRRLEAAEGWILLINVAIQGLASFAIVAFIFDSRDPLLLGTTILYTLTRTYATHLADRLRVDGRIGAYTVVQTVGPVLGLPLGLWAASTILPGPQGALAGYGVALLASLIFVLPSINVRPTLTRPDRALLRAAFTYGLPLAFSGALVWVSANGIRFVIEHRLDAAAVGLFSVGWTIGQRASLFAAMLVTAAAFPLVLRIDATGARGQALQQVATNGALLCAVLFPACAGLAILSGPLTRLTVATDYVALTTVILPIATLGGFIKNLRSHFANQPFLLAEKTRWTLGLDIVEAVLFLAGAIVGLELYGLIGAAAGSLLSVVVGAAWAFWLSVKKLGMPMPVAHLLRISLATAVMSLAVAAIPAERWDLFLLAVVVGAGVYAGVLALLYRGQLGEFRAALKPSAS